MSLTSSTLPHQPIKPSRQPFSYFTDSYGNKLYRCCEAEYDYKHKDTCKLIYAKNRPEYTGCVEKELRVDHKEHTFHHSCPVPGACGKFGVKLFDHKSCYYTDSFNKVRFRCCHVEEGYQHSEKCKVYTRRISVREAIGPWSRPPLSTKQIAFARKVRGIVLKGYD